MVIERYDRRRDRFPRLSHDAMRTIMSRADRGETLALLACYGWADVDYSGGWSPELVEGLEDAIDHALASPVETADVDVEEQLGLRAHVSGVANAVLARMGVPPLHLRACTVMADRSIGVHTRSHDVAAHEVRGMLHVGVTFDGARLSTTPEATALLVPPTMPQTLRLSMVGLPMERVVDHPLLHGLGLVAIDVANVGDETAIRFDTVAV